MKTNGRIFGVNFHRIISTYGNIDNFHRWIVNLLSLKKFKEANKPYQRVLFLCIFAHIYRFTQNGCEEK